MRAPYEAAGSYSCDLQYWCIYTVLLITQQQNYRKRLYKEFSKRAFAKNFWKSLANNCCVLVASTHTYNHCLPTIQSVLDITCTNFSPGIWKAPLVLCTVWNKSSRNQLAKDTSRKLTPVCDIWKVCLASNAWRQTHDVFEKFVQLICAILKCVAEVPAAWVYIISYMFTCQRTSTEGKSSCDHTQFEDVNSTAKRSPSSAVGSNVVLHSPANWWGSTGKAVSRDEIKLPSTDADNSETRTPFEYPWRNCCTCIRGCPSTETRQPFWKPTNIHVQITLQR